MQSPIQAGNAVLFVSSWLKKQCPIEKLDLLYVLILVTGIYRCGGKGPWCLDTYSEKWPKNVFISRINEVPLLARCGRYRSQTLDASNIFPYHTNCSVLCMTSKIHEYQKRCILLLLFLVHFHYQYNIF